LPSNNGEASGEGLGFYYSKKHVLYSKLRPYLNKVALPEQEGRCSTELIPLAPANGVEREYLAFLLRSPLVLKRAVSANNGSRMPRADLNMLFKMEIDCPDLPAQRRIAARLKKQLAAVDEMRQAAKDQEDAVMPLFEKTLAEAFHGITPLSLGIRANKAPTGWQWRRLLDLARLESGHTPSRRHPEYWENGEIPWLALPDIRALDCQVVHDTSEHTNKLGIANSSARILPENTVALSRTASVGFVTRFGRPMATSQDFVNWICGTELDPGFLLWLLRASRKFIRSVSTGAIHQTVYVDVVNRFEVCIPDLARQRKIAARMDSFFTQTAKLRQALGEQNEAISALPGAYLAEAFGNPD
jgi:type I restriction enzyme S subunit